SGSDDSGDVASGAQSAPASRGEPGLVLTLRGTQSGRETVRRARVAAYAAASGSEPCDASFRGSWNVPESGAFQLSASGRGRVKVFLDGAAVLAAEGEDLSRAASEWMRLRRGGHAL